MSRHRRLKRTLRSPSRWGKVAGNRRMRVVKRALRDMGRLMWQVPGE